jgi:hypothetical protein
LKNLNPAPTNSFDPNDRKTDATVFSISSSSYCVLLGYIVDLKGLSIQPAAKQFKDGDGKEITKVGGGGSK